MPSLSRWLVRLALVEFVAGAAIGALMLTARGLSALEWTWALRPLHVELVTFGWIVNLAFGVAYWILPRLPRGTPRGAVIPAVAAGVLLNIGVLLGGVGPLLGARVTAPLAGRAAELLAAIAFALHAWKRVRRPVFPSPRQEPV